MRIDNSGFTKFWECPTLWHYQSGLGLHKTLSYLEFGSKFHKKLEDFYKPAPPATIQPVSEPEFVDEFGPGEVALSQLDRDVEVMFEAYKAAYPSESFEVVDCERAFELDLGPVKCKTHLIKAEIDGPRNLYRCSECEWMSCDTIQHKYLGKIDMLVRDHATGRLKVFETKTESRLSKRNLPQAWAARTQASLYTWAASQIYEEPIDSIILNVCTKASPKGQVGPSFRRDVLERTPAQIEQALKDLIWVADRLEEMQEDGVYPRNTNNCVGEYGYPCDFYSVCHAGGMTPEKLVEFVQVEPFSHLQL